MWKFNRTSGLVIAFVVSMMLPDNWYEQFHFGGVPVATIVLAVVCLALIVEILRKPAMMRLWLGLGVAALIGMSVEGYLRGNIDVYSLKYYVADIFLFGAFLAGYTLGIIRDSESIARLVPQLATVAGGAIVVTYIGLYFGVVTTEFQIGGRTMTQSIFFAIGLLVILLPWAAVSTRQSDKYGGWRTLMLFAVAFGTCLLSATRSSMIEVVLAAALYVVLKRRRFSVGFLLRLAGGVALLLLPISSGLYSTFVFQRLGSTEFTGELRYAELGSWWDQTKDDALLGQGMGSEFVTAITGNTYALAPHIGIVTYLMKGGVLLLFACVIVPLFWAIKVLFSPRRPEFQRGAAASVLVYMSLACLSGGWDALELFAYGLAVSCMTTNRLKPVTQLRRSALLGDQLTFQHESPASHR